MLTGTFRGQREESTKGKESKVQKSQREKPSQIQKGGKLTLFKKFFGHPPRNT